MGVVAQAIVSRARLGPLAFFALGLALISGAICRLEWAAPLRPLPASTAPRPEPPWLPIHPERLPRLAKIPVYAVCFGGTRPVAVASPPLDLPAGHPLRRIGGVVLAHCEIDLEGWVVQAQLLKPDAPRIRQALVRTLAQWRFTPARSRSGQPAAVHFVVALKVAPNGGSSVSVIP